MTSSVDAQLTAWLDSFAMATHLIPLSACCSMLMFRHEWLAAERFVPCLPRERYSGDRPASADATCHVDQGHASHRRPIRDRDAATVRTMHTEKGSYSRP